MGKVKKAAPPEKQEESQRKISSFFQKPPVSSANKLFTEVGVASKSSHSHGFKSNEMAKDDRTKMKPRDVIVLDDTDDFVDASKNCRKINSASKLENTLSAAGNIKSKTADTCTFKHKEPEVIPETQFSTTPKGRIHGHIPKENETFLSPSSENIGFDAIPDTPTNNADISKPKRPLGRSFLLSTTAMSTNPIQAAKENRDHAKEGLKKKRALLARKSLVSLSVEFTGNKRDAKIIKEDEQLSAKTDSVIQNKFTKDEITNSDKVEFISPEAHKNICAIEDNVTTPTKIYSDGSSIKRMAKSGISPDVKRTTADVVTDDGADHVMKQLDFIERREEQIGEKHKDELAIANCNFGNIRENEEYVEKFNRKAALEIERQEILKKEKLERLEKLKLEKIEEKKKLAKEKQKKYHETLVNYQLSGNSGLGKAGLTQKEESVQNDDTLDDLLEELRSPSLIKSSSITGKHSKQDDRSNAVTSRISGRSNLKSGKRKGCESEKSLIKRKSLESVLVDESTVAVGDKENSTCEMSVPNVIKRGSLIAQKKEIDIKTKVESVTTEWTNDDEEYFTKLGVETSSATCDTSSCVSSNDDKRLPTLTKDNTFANQTSKSKGRKVKIKQSGDSNIIVEKCTKPYPECNIGENKISHMKSTKKADNDIDIDLFPTPRFQATERSRSPEEMTIDEFGTQLDSQVLCEEFDHLTPFENVKNEAKPGICQTTPPCSEFGRHTVTDIQIDNSKHEMALTLTSQPVDLVQTCILHGFWLDTHVAVGDTVHVMAEFTDGVCHVRDNQGLLVVNPDALLSGTTVVGSVFCMRRSILKEKFKGCESGNVQMLYGSIIHNIFQQVLRKKLLTETEILVEAGRILKESGTIVEMYGRSVTEGKVMEEVKSYLPQIIAWTKQYTNIGQDVLGNQRLSQPDVLVTKVSDIEENIWSPRFGIKGKIDLTVEVQMKNEKKKSILPLELKTGKPSYSVEHKGQVTLYSMMCSDRREDPRRGLLLYLREPSMKVIPADYVNQKGLIQLRNEMAYYISRQVKKTCVAEETTFNLGRLPEPISNLRACQKCPQVLNCAVYQRHVEGRPCDQSGMSQLVDETLQHLSPDHVTYFTQWCLMLDLEMQTDRAKKTVADIWCRSSQEREELGQCLGSMVLETDLQLCNDGDDSVNIAFHRHPQCLRESPLSSIGLNVQDSIVVSCERPAWVAVCTGFVHHISRTDIQVLVDRDAISRLIGLKDQTFRIDKCDSFSTAGIFYTNVSRLMADDSHCHNLRRLIIDKVKPEFQNTLPKANIEKVKKILKSLNKPQKTAILKALMSKQYVLIKGYPGTGKTSTIVALVKVLHTLGLSVLLTSYTHSAVDNILLKLIKDGVKFLRLGRLAKIHPAVREFSIDRLTRDITSPGELEKFLHSQMIVATSCLGTNHAVFGRRQFDVCIVDEASQVVQAACLGPMFSSHRFILVGDPKQLPPVVQSGEARNLGMDESLFVRLDRLGATFTLNLQYRMNSEIMHLSNRLVYDGCLKCGSDDVANRVLHLPHRDRVEHDAREWMADVGDSSLHKAVLFLDTHQVPAPETKDKGGVLKNVTEAKLVLSVVEYLIQAGVSPSDIGIIAPYRSQVFLLRNMLTEGPGHLATSGVEVNTVDQYQGRDKEVILISFVRSSADKDSKTGELLKDVRRLNVAVTRAKSKLILVGDGTTLARYQPLCQLLQIVRDKQQLPYPVAPSDEVAHNCER